MSATEGIR